MHKPHRTHAQRQDGAVLVIALILMTVLTLVSVTSMQVTTLEEKMTGNAIDRQFAFQAAESTLRHVEQDIIEALPTTSTLDNSISGFYAEGTDEPDDLFDITSWTATGNSVEHGAFTYNVKTPPRYMYKLMSTQKVEGGALNITGYGEKIVGSEAALFRITTRATGATDNAQTVLRTYYGKIF